MPPGRRRSLPVTRQALLHDPDLLFDAPPPPAAGRHDLEPAGKATVSMHIHKDSELREARKRQRVFTGWIR